MIYIYYSISLLLVIATLIPLLNQQHWFVRIFDFGKIQLFFIQNVVLIIGLFLPYHHVIFYIIYIALLLTTVYNASILFKFSKLNRSAVDIKYNRKQSKPITLITCNVYQFNTEYDKLIQIIKTIQPQVLLTIESNKDWEKGLKPIEDLFTSYTKVPLENTYGMHFYTSLDVEYAKVNYLVSADIPSVEVKLKSEDGESFIFYGVHPPPPSPTEEETSKERDGELLALAKKIVKQEDISTVVAGDFNNVSWAKSSELFKKKSKLIDPRIGRGFFSTFHAKYWWLRFPIDQIYHSKNIIVHTIKTLSDINSDHLPLYLKFSILKDESVLTQKNETLSNNEEEKIEYYIEEGKKTDGDRDKIASEE